MATHIRYLETHDPVVCPGKRVGSWIIVSTGAGIDSPLPLHMIAYWDGELRVEDISTHKFTTIPDSNGALWSIRWSPDGRYVEARRNGNSMEIYDFSSQRWTKIQDGPSDWPSWSGDSRFIYYFSWPTSMVYRVPVTGGTPQQILDLHDFKQTGWAGGWMGLDPGDTPVLLRDTGTSDIYALTLERK
jgi:WD40 repeat protein